MAAARKYSEELNERATRMAMDAREVPVAVVVEYIDAHRDRVVEGRKLGVEPICAVLKEAGVTPLRRSSAWTLRGAVDTQVLGVHGLDRSEHLLRRKKPCPVGSCGPGR